MIAGAIIEVLLGIKADDSRQLDQQLICELNLVLIPVTELASRGNPRGKRPCPHQEDDVGTGVTVESSARIACMRPAHRHRSSRLPQK
jgi:hypothetical protein